MNGAHWHLVLNHLPIIIPMVGLLVMIAGVLIQSEILKRAAFSIFILGALTAIAAFTTGEGAEEVVEEIGGIDERLIGVHEDIAQIFAIILYVLGAISLIGIWASWKGKSFSTTIAFVTIVLSLAGLYYAQQTGTSGGEIRHTEIRADGLNNNSTANPAGETGEENDDD